MSVHIRLARVGAKKRPFYRLVVTDHRSPRGGRFLENIGTFDPAGDSVFQVDTDRLTYWRGHGATPSETVMRLIKKHQKTAAAAEAAAAPAAAATAGAKAGAPKSKKKS